ncbi:MULTISPECIES: SsgA family sporulation/cell division regulator [unclassified Streptomyces]|uniref:SsgA family sporulation/cell division regulator n=1 Tax=unclassified Streptomyces TaxID=2593676 RepID=UPI0033F0C191
MLTDIDHIVQARLHTPKSGPEGHEITATLRYHRDDPLAARMAFPPSVSLDGAEVTWVFARGLLTTGLYEPAGEGDVHVRPAGPDRTVLEFRAPAGVALVEVATTDLRIFLARVYEAVPPGHEFRGVDMDAVIASLLGEE